jgi:hypothetical protein
MTIIGSPQQATTPIITASPAPISFQRSRGA